MSRGQTCADLFGYVAPTVERVKREVNRRKSVQDKKEELRAELKRLIDVPPKSLGSAGVEKTRAWVEAMSKARKVYKSERSSVPRLQAAVNSMKGEWK